MPIAPHPSQRSVRALINACGSCVSRSSNFGSPDPVQHTPSHHPLIPRIGCFPLGAVFALARHSFQPAPGFAASSGCQMAPWRLEFRIADMSEPVECILLGLRMPEWKSWVHQVGSESAIPPPLHHGCLIVQLHWTSARSRPHPSWRMALRRSVASVVASGAMGSARSHSGRIADNSEVGHRTARRRRLPNPHLSNVVRLAGHLPITRNNADSEKRLHNDPQAGLHLNFLERRLPTTGVDSGCAAIQPESDSRHPRTELGGVWLSEGDFTRLIGAAGAGGLERAGGGGQSGEERRRPQKGVGRIGREGRSHGFRGPVEGVELALSGLIGAFEEIQVCCSGSRTSRRWYTGAGREAKKEIMDEPQTVPQTCRECCRVTGCAPGRGGRSRSRHRTFPVA